MAIVFSSGRLPLMLNAPLPNDAKARLLKLPPTTPAFNAAMPIGLRPLNDIISMSFAVIVMRTATSFRNGTDSAVTESVSVPASSVRFERDPSSRIQLTIRSSHVF